MTKEHPTLSSSKCVPLHALANFVLLGQFYYFGLGPTRGMGRKLRYTMA